MLCFPAFVEVDGVFFVGPVMSMKVFPFFSIAEEKKEEKKEESEESDDDMGFGLFD